MNASTLNQPEESALNDLAGLISPMSSLQDRITLVMCETGWTPAQIARAAGVEPAAVTHWTKGDTKSIKYANAVRLSKATGYHIPWLIDGKGAKRIEPAQLFPPPPVYAGRRSGARPVPIVGTARMGEKGYYEEISSTPGAGDGYISIATEDPTAYGLRVRGDSMAPAIRDGWYVLVEPDGAPTAGEYVLIKLKDGQRMVKELLYQRADSIEVLSVNSGERHTIYLEDLESLQAVAAVVAPSKWKPD